MKRAKKIVAVAVLALVLVVVLAVVWIDWLAKVAVESAGTHALGVKTTVDGVDVGIFSRSCTMSRLQVDNPAGFKSDYFLKLNNGSIDVSLGSLIGDTVEVPRLALSGIRMNLVREHRETNVRTIIDNIVRFEASLRSADSGKSDDEERKKFIFREVVIEDVEVNINLLPIGGELTTLNIVIDDLRLENVGSEGNNGESLARVTAVVVRAILDAVTEKGESVLPPDLLAELREKLAGMRPLRSLRETIRERAPSERRFKNRRQERKSRREGIEA